MEVFRISKAIYADKLQASGNAGRWNYGGERVIYAAATRSLAALELLVHLSGLPLQHAFRVMVIYLPEDLSILRTELNDLPPDWSGRSPYGLTQEMGSAWLRANKHCVLRVPSSLIPQEYIFVLNVLHPAFDQVALTGVERFAFDPRLRG